MSKNEYVVKKGETLWEISKKIYGTGELYHIIAKENKISNPDTIQNGQIIKIPDVEFYTEKEVLEEAEKCEELEKEIERLNNIIDEADTKNLELIQKINKIYDVIENKNITGIEARLLIQDILDRRNKQI